MASTPSVAVIGGGSTGTGVARDLAMRGVDVTLLEQGNLTHGTTGRMHDLLHSGGRSAVSDQGRAAECVEENRVLRNIATHCVETTGGLFVKRSEDTEEYFERKLRGCEDCGVPAEAISGEEAREREPSLAGDVDKAIAVPDGAIDPYRLVSRSALRRGRGRHDVGDSCSSISGTCGWKAEKYDLSMAIGEEMFEHVEAARAWTGLTECPTCAMQMEHGTGYEIRHPLEVIEPVLVIGGN